MTSKNLFWSKTVLALILFALLIFSPSFLKKIPPQEVVYDSTHILNGKWITQAKGEINRIFIKPSGHIHFYTKDTIEVGEDLWWWSENDSTYKEEIVIFGYNIKVDLYTANLILFDHHSMEKNSIPILIRSWEDKNGKNTTLEFDLSQKKDLAKRISKSWRKEF